MFEGFTVIFVDDDSAVRSSLTQTLELAGLRVVPCASAQEALGQVSKGLQGIVISDVRMPGMDGMELLARVRSLDAEIPVILITAHGDVSLAVQAMRLGAYDFIEKPFAPERFVETAVRAMEKRVMRVALDTLRGQLQEKIGLEAALLGQSKAMREVREQVLLLAATPADVMILGETGTGKELVARCLHDHSKRRDRHFVAINCAGLPDTLLESELFGHEAGAFTGAQKRRIGKIEFANGGTLLLDEIESMPMSFQAKLLRTLQERKVTRLGSNEELSVDVRIIAATKEDLLAMSRQQLFRSDLYYRLNVAVMTLPPLRERKEDLALLLEHFLTQASRRYERAAPQISAAYLQHLLGHDWPGNVREVRNVADRLVLGLAGLAGDIGGEQAASAAPPSLPQHLDAQEKIFIEKTLAAYQGEATASASALGIGKKTLYEKLQRHHIDIKAYRFGPV